MARPKSIKWQNISCIDVELAPIDENFRYYITRDGRVLDTQKDRWLKATDCTGYWTVFVYGLKRIHRLLAKAYIENPNGYQFVDHVDQNPLNNALSNLRWASGSMNSLNKRKKTNATSEYMGVCKHGRKWIARFRQIYIGSYKTEEQAARAYNEVAVKEGALHLNKVA